MEIKTEIYEMRVDENSASVIILFRYQGMDTNFKCTHKINFNKGTSLADLRTRAIEEFKWLLKNCATSGDVVFKN